MMKNKKHSQGKIKGIVMRVLLVGVLLALVGAALTGCSAAPAHQITSGNIDTDPDNALQSSELREIADFVVNNQTYTVKLGGKDFTLQEGLVSAYNGYDVTAEGFDDNRIKEMPQDKSKAPEYALKFFKKAAEASGGKLSFEASKYEKMNKADLETLVNSIKVSVDTTAPGFLGTIFLWIGVAFKWMIDVLGFGSFIVGSLFFAILVELIMLPISIKQQKNSRRQAMLRPKEMAIRKKYAGRTDQATMQKQQMEITEMYQKEGFNPMTAGCLPLIISMLIVIPLYYIVIDPVQYILGCPEGVAQALNTFASAPNAAGGLGMVLQSDRGTIEILSHLKGNEGAVEAIKDFAFFNNGGAVWDILRPALGKEIPNFSLFGLNFGLNPSFGEPWALLSIPVLTFVVYFFSMKLNRKFSYQPQTTDDKQAGCSNTVMDVTMPLMSVYIAFIVPAAVGVYWIFKSIIGTVKQFIMSKAMPMPKFTEEDYKAAERELLGKEKKKPKKPSGTRNPNVRSLHYIDDDEYENIEKPETNGHGGVKKPKAEYVEEDDIKPIEEAKATEKKEEEKNSLTNGATLKDDDRRERDQK